MLRKPSPYQMYGIHPVAAAIANPDRTCLQLQATEPAHKTLSTILQARAPSPIAQKRLAQAFITAKQTIDKLHKAETTHQSVSLKCLPLTPPPLFELIDSLRQRTTTTLVMLDRVQDPHNLGAILRSACFFHAQAVLLAKGHAPQENASIAKAACGALETLPILHTNLAQALTTLGRKGWSRIAFDAQNQDQENPNQKNNLAENNILTAEHKVLVFGAEGKGLRRLVREHCDLATHIEGGNETVESLNVSNAVAVALANYSRSPQPSNKNR